MKVEHGTVMCAYMHATHEQWETNACYEVPVGALLPDGSQIKAGEVVVVKDGGPYPNKISEFFRNKNNLVGWKYYLNPWPLPDYYNDDYVGEFDDDNESSEENEVHCQARTIKIDWHTNQFFQR